MKRKILEVSGLVMIFLGILLFMFGVASVIKENHRAVVCEQQHGIYVKTHDGYECFARLEE